MWVAAKNPKQTENPIYRKLIHKGLEAGYVVSIFDGENWSVERSRDETEILAARHSVPDFTKIRFRTMVGKFIGDVVLIDVDDDDVVADWTDNFATNELAKEILG